MSSFLEELVGIGETLITSQNKTAKKPQTTASSAAKGFAAFAPLMQSFLDAQASGPKSETRVEDLDNDGIVNVIGAMGQNSQLSALMQNIDINQIGNIVSFLIEQNAGASKSATKQSSDGIANILNVLQGMDFEDLHLEQALGSLINLFGKR